MKKEKKKTTEEKYKKSLKELTEGPQMNPKKTSAVTGEPIKEKKPDQPNLFGEQDEVYNTIQEEITIVADAIQGCHDAIGKKEDLLDELQKRSQKLHTAAATVAKIRDAGPKKQGKEENKGASWPKEK